MLDLSVTKELVAFVVCCALSAVWLIFVVDIFSVKTPGKGLKAASITLGIVGIMLAALAAFVTAGLLLGYAVIEGDSFVAFGFAVPAVAPYAALFTRPVMWGFSALIAVLSLLLVIGGALKSAKQKPKLYAPEVESAPPEADAAATEDGGGEEEESYEMDEVRDMMDEISGLVDRLDSIAESLKEPSDLGGQMQEEPDEEGREEQATESVEELSDEQEEETVEELPQEEESDEIGFDYEEESAPEVEEERYDEPVGEPNEEEDEGVPAGADGPEEEFYDDRSVDEDIPYVDEEERSEPPKVAQEDAKASANRTEPLRTLTRTVRSEPRKFTPINTADDGYPTPAARTLVRTKDGVKKVGAESVKETEREPLRKEPQRPAKRAVKKEPQSATANAARPAAPKAPVRDAEPQPTEGAARPAAPKTPVKEVEPIIGGLPITKRHVLINRRNVVNMFSEYLKSKSEDDKKRLEDSINTIIIK